MNSIFKKVSELTGIDLDKIEETVEDFSIDQLYELIAATKMGDRAAVIGVLEPQTTESAKTDSRLLQLAGRSVLEDDGDSEYIDLGDISELEVQSFSLYGGGYAMYRQRLGALQIVDSINQVINMLPLASSIDQQLLKDATNRLVSAVDKMGNQEQ